MLSRVMNGTAVANVRRWTPPEMDAQSASGAPPPAQRGDEAGEFGVATASPCDEQMTPEPIESDHEAVERLREEAWQAGFASGHAEGISQGEVDARALMETVRQIVDELSEPLAAVDAEVERELVKLVAAISRQLIRRELASDHGQVVAAVKEALALLPETHRDVVLHLNPEDARLVSERLHMEECERSYRLVEDPLITRGGCRVVTSLSAIDATVESRTNAAIARALGDERIHQDD